jgi:leucyl-tRNA synthetase
MRATGYLGTEEPFAGLFTQGMVTHESYRAADGRWLAPDEVERDADGVATERETGGPVTIGRSEKMSKSKRNTVDPGAIIERFGADTARWFILSDNPPDRDMEWTEAGAVGAYRFVQRLFRLAETVRDLRAGSGSAVAGRPEAFGDTALALRQAVHRTIQAVTDALEAFTFNVAVARIYELTNAAAETAKRSGEPGVVWALGEAVEILARLISPMMPHLAEEAFACLHPASPALVADMAWPMADAGLAAVSRVTIAVQIMGKLRGTIEAAPGAAAETVLAAAEAEPNVARLLAGQRIVKRVHVPDRIVNFVVAS